METRLRSEFGEKEWFERLGLRVSDEQISNRRKFNAVVYVNDIETAGEEVPSEKDGIGISIEEDKRVVPYECHNFCNYSNFSCVPGGAFVQRENWDGGDPTCHTGTCIVEYNNGFYYMTVYHGLGNFGSTCEDVTGLEVYQGSWTQYIGDVVNHDEDQDWVIVEEAWNSDIDGFDNSIIGENEGIWGHVTAAGVVDLISSNETIFTYGARS